MASYIDRYVPLCGRKNLAKYYSDGLLEELDFVVDPGRIRQIRILSRSDVVDKAKRDFRRFRQEMSNKGIEVEWRTTKESAFHDRYIVASNVVYNVPPVNAMFQGSYGEALETPIRPPFEDWWRNATPVQ